jgi:hypothetical protein
MKRFVLAVTIVLFVAPASAEGGRNGAAAAGAVGGLALGAMLGSALAAPRPVYVAPRPVYVAPAPVYVEPAAEECYVSRERVWVPGWGWEMRRRTVCE